MKGYRAIRSAYHSVTTDAFRTLIYRCSPRSVKRLKKQVVAEFEKHAAHDEIYDASYYAKFIEPTMQLSAAVMAKSIVDELRPKSVIDVGCGTGVLLEELRKRDVNGRGLELSLVAIEICLKRGLDVQCFDIEKDPIPEVRADVVISTEVAEHLPASSAEHFIEMLCRFGNRIVLTAATPSQGGTDHVNEQPNEYWIKKLDDKGFRYERDQSLRWRDEWKAQGVAACFWSSLMIYSKGEVSHGDQV